jgi:hypothetical protein
MLTLVRRGMPAVFLGAGVVVSHVAAAFVLAEEPSAAPAATTQTSTPVFSDQIQLLNAFALLLIFAIVVITLIIWYLRRAEDRYFLAAERLGRFGITTTSDLVSATAGSALGAQTLDTDATLTVTGPGKLVVGTAVEYRATSASGVATTATWAVAPSDAADLSSASGERVTVTPKKAGALTINATADGKSVAIAATIEAPSSSGTKLPFVGGGWGSIIAAVVIAVLVAVLGVARVLGAEAIASLLGTLAGYLFGLRAGNSSPPAEGGNSGTNPAPKED